MARYYTITGKYSKEKYLVSVSLNNRKAKVVLTVWNPNHWEYSGNSVSYNVRAGADIRSDFLWLADWKAKRRVDKVEKAKMKNDKAIYKVNEFTKKRGL